MKKLFLIRHAHRDKDLGAAFDNGLSEKGRGQAKQIRDYFMPLLKREDSCQLLSSPKKRCIETLTPLADKMDLKIKIDKNLNEQGVSEMTFDYRLEAFLEDWLGSKHSVTLACSHGDVIPYFCEKFLNLHLSLKKGGIVEVHAEKKKLGLHQVIQKIPE